MFRRHAALIIVLLMAVTATAGGAPKVPPPPDRLDLPAAKSPSAALAAIRLRPGLRVELVAAEPLVMDPVDIAWGPDGRLWVVEMSDYPLGIDGKGKPGGRVKFLEDTNGDGTYDRATLFLDNLPFPNGVMPWRKGVLISAAPSILYAEDTDGDGKADVQRPLFAGFGEGNQQHRVNGLRWGLDNWIYIANGDSDGRIRSTKTGPRTPSPSPPGGEGAEIDIRGRDLRIRPDEGLLEPQTGRTQFGRNRDDWGNWFGCNNSNPMWHFVLDDHYLRRNPHLAVAKGTAPVSETPGTARVFPISKTLDRFNALDMVNRFTSACGTMVCRDTSSPFHGNAFVCEPVHNLVHREIMSANGMTFSSRRADDEQSSEFLASSDNWFRPTAVHTGPDGALWVVDMYRLVIEHPQWIPQDWQQRLDLRAGHDRGRIYRVVAADAAFRPVPRLDKFDTAGLVAALDSGNGWQRDLAQQMLIWRGGQAAVPALREMAKTESPLARLHALCTLDGLRALRMDDVRRALRDSHPGVRRHAIRLSEPFLRSGAIREELLALVTDSDLQVRMQLACSLGEVKDAVAGTALAQIALAGAEFPHLLTAVYSSLNETNIAAALAAVLKSGDKAPATVLEQMIRFTVALRNDSGLDDVVAFIGSPEKPAAEHMAALSGALAALRNRGALSALVQRPALRRIIEHAKTVAVASKAAPADRLAAIRLLGNRTGDDEQISKLLAGLLNPRSAPEIQQAVLAALGERGAVSAAGQILYAWTVLTPRLRTQALDLLLSRQHWTNELLGKIEKDASFAVHIDAVARQRLSRHKSPEIQARAARLLAAGSADRRKVMHEFQSVLTLKGDVARGRDVFRERCAACHKLEGVGQQVGPDLTALTNKSPQFLLEAMLDPNAALEDRFVSYLAATADGRFFTGLLASENSTSVTVITQDGKEQTLLRGELDELQSTGKSLMPEGLEKDMTPQHFADVIAYTLHCATLSGRDGQEASGKR